MSAGERSLADVLRDVLCNLQEIVRSEVRLARTEITAEAGRARSLIALLAAGAVAALFTALFLLLSLAFALALVLPLWVSMLVPGVLLAVVAGLLLAAGRGRLRRRRPLFERTVETLKENVTWAQQRTK